MTPLESGLLRMAAGHSNKEELRTRWYHYIAYFFGGAFLANAIPHFVTGGTGHPFQSPFAKPPGQGLSQAWVNFLWGLPVTFLAFSTSLNAQPNRNTPPQHSESVSTITGP